jgi:calcyphosin
LSRIECLVQNFRQKVLARGATTIIGLGRSFRVMDDDRSGHIDIDEFTKAVIEHRLDIREANIRQLFHVFDSDNSGYISYNEFIR